MTQYSPQVDLTIFPKVNYYKTFGTRFDARADNGRIFMSGDPVVPLAIAEGQGANWVSTNVYEIGQVVEARTAEFTGGKEPVTYRYRFQTKAPGSDTWVNGSWTSTTNAKNLATFNCINAGQVKLQSQARDASDPVVQLNSVTGIKTIPQVTIGDITIVPSSTSAPPGEIITFTASWTGDAQDSLPSWRIRSGPGIIYSSMNIGDSIEVQVNPDATNGDSIQVMCDITNSNASDNPQSAVATVVVSSSGTF